MTTKHFCFGALLLAVLVASHAQAAEHRRRVIIDQDAFGPAGSNMQAILMLLQAPDVEVLGITIVSGDGWRDEEVDHTLRLLEIAGRTDVPVIPGAVLPLVNSAARTKAWESAVRQAFLQGRLDRALARPRRRAARTASDGPVPRPAVARGGAAHQGRGRRRRQLSGARSAPPSRRSDHHRSRDP